MPLAHARCKPLLVLSWAAFALAILCIVVSFLVSQKAFFRQISDAENYFIDGQADALERKNVPAAWVQGLNMASVAFFIHAVGLTVVFISINILEG